MIDKMKKGILILLVLLVVFDLGFAIKGQKQAKSKQKASSQEDSDSPSDRFAKTPVLNKAAANFEPEAAKAADQDVFSRKLLENDVKYNRALFRDQAHLYFKETARRRLSTPLLGYVTPWNSYGYDIARRFRGKFTHISPVWYQLKFKGAEELELAGAHDVDVNWLRDITSAPEPGAGAAENQPHTRVVPRVLLEGWTPSNYQHVIEKDSMQTRVIAALVKEVEAHDYDGITLECADAWGKISFSHGAASRAKWNAFIVRL